MQFAVVTEGLKLAIQVFKTSLIRFQMPDELVSAYDWTSSLEKQMMENVESRSQKVFLKLSYG